MGGHRTPEAIRELVIEIARETGWYTRIHGAIGTPCCMKTSGAGTCCLSRMGETLARSSIDLGIADGCGRLAFK
jgi:hypothetical protein